MSTLNVTTSRKVDPQEIRDLIWGTGALTWSWWGKVTEEREGFFRFHHDGENSEEGAHDVSTLVSMDGIVGAAGLRLTELARLGLASGDIRDAINENLGYLDAAEADLVLQMAVLKKLVFG